MWRKILVISIIVGVLAACNSPTPTPAPPTEAPLAGRITFAGSTTIQPLAKEIGEAFRKVYPNVELEIAAGGSRVGIQAVHEGTADIGMASRGLSEEEATGIELHQIGVDVIAMIVNADNPVEGITMEELRKIYFGEITNWSELGGPDQNIVVVQREQTSGTRGAFDDIALEDEEATAPQLETVMTAGDVAATVGDDAAAIGYVGFGNIEENIKMLAIDDVVPSPESALDGSYSLKRPLFLLTGPLSQPLAQEFIDFATGSEGRKVVVENGWIPPQ